MARLRFGPSLAKARVRLGVSQKELGLKLNPPLSQAMISQWEEEHAFPSEEQKAQVKSIIGTTPNDADSSSPDMTSDATVSPSAIGAWLNKYRLGQQLSVPELAERSGLSAVSIYNIESGRSQNPQRSTVGKLEKALRVNISAEAKEEAKDEATIEGVGEWFNFDPNSESEWPGVAGIYVLYDISDRPIYVGQGQKISTRLRDHQDKFWYKRPIVQNAAYVGIADKILREQIEKVLIKFLKSNAVLNQQNVDR
jgi:transcriptional regulator with XRE-family HTH domain